MGKLKRTFKSNLLYKSDGKIIKYNFPGEDWCVPWRCPCLTCERWLQEEIKYDCCCAPCEIIGLRRPEDIVCWKTKQEQAEQKKEAKDLDQNADPNQISIFDFIK